MAIDLNELSPQLLYRRIQQPIEPPDLTLETVTVTPAMASEWLHQSDKDESFHNRPTRPGDVRRWRLLMETGRFIHWLPDGPILFDVNGTLLNGKHRLTAVCEWGQPVGLTVIRDVPRWMMDYFDTGRGRNLNDLFAIKGHASVPQIGSTCRLAMRYEEVVRGKRPALGWRAWPTHRDEFPDVGDFLARRTELTDLIGSADAVYRGSKIIIAAAMVFRFYQELAWPEGEPVLRRFWEGLAKGAMLDAGDPALALREWSRDVHMNKERIPAKREAHLLLLFRCFAASAQGQRVPRIQFGYGQPLEAPFHPKGPKTAVLNIHAALDAMDAGSVRGVIEQPKAQPRRRPATETPVFRAG